MAFIDFNTGYAEAARAAVAEPAPAKEGSLFSPLEWTTIALARNDSLSSIDEPSRMSRALGSLFGIGTQSKLADQHLEALRRLTINAWHYGYRVPVSEIKAFFQAGFSADQLETVLAHATTQRAQVRHSRWA